MSDNNQKSRRDFVAGIIGNLLDRYDMALYGLTAAFIAPNFFPSDEHVVSLIKAYGIMALGIFTRPVGAFIFGKLAMHIGGKKVMIICLLGVAICTGLLGFIPSYQNIGPLSTAIFVLTRITQGIFASGENCVASFFIIDRSDIGRTTRASAFYNCSTMIGVVFASLAATLVSYSSDPTYYWRFAFFVGFLTALVGVFLRGSIFVDNEVLLPRVSFRETLNLLTTNKVTILRIIIVSSFSYITYTIPFVFMNSFIPEITNIQIGEMLQLNSVLLILDTALIPIFGIIAENYNRAKFMATMSALVAITIIPLFYFLENSGFIYVMFVRLVVILTGLAYLAPIQAWYYDLFSGPERYLLTGISYSIGEEILGRNSTVICLSLWYYFRSPVAPAIFIALIAILATIALLVPREKEKS